MSRYALLRKIIAFLADEGVAAVFEPGRGDGGTLFVQQGGAYNPGQPVTGPYAVAWPTNAPTQVVLAVEHYGRIVRILQKKLPVSIELTVQNTFYDDQQGFNVLA